MFQKIRSWLICVQEVASCKWWWVTKGKVCVDYLEDVKMLKENYHSERSFKPNTIKNIRRYVIISPSDSSFRKVVYTLS